MSNEERRERELKDRKGVAAQKDKGSEPVIVL